MPSEKLHAILTKALFINGVIWALAIVDFWHKK
jgi:hypothetical protein